MTNRIHIANIGPREQARRRNFGLVSLAIAIILGAVLLVSGLPWWVRFSVFIPLAGAMSGLLQARAKT